MAKPVTTNAVDPLRELLDSTITRIETLELHCGIKPKSRAELNRAISTKGGAGSLGSSLTVSMHSVVMGSSRHLGGNVNEMPAVKAFDKYMDAAVYKCSDACDELKMGDDVGKLFVEIFEGMRYVIVLASKSKQPTDPTEIVPHLTAMTEPMSKLRALRLKRDFDNHYKAIVETLGCVSWVTLRAPAQLPAPFVMECVGSSEFWSNRIRKEWRNKKDDEEKAKPQLAFCDSLKDCLVKLADYIKEHHKTGLAFNCKGVSLAESAIRMTDNPLHDAAVEANRKKDQLANKKSVVHNTMGGNMVGLVAELAKKKTDDGNSAATGLRKVTKDQQTWRKEFKGDKPKPKVLSPAPKPVAPRTPSKKKRRGLPILEYQERGTKWVVENHDKESAKAASPENSLLQVEISDPKQQVYLYNCEEVTLKVGGQNKCKSIIIDNCVKVNVIFHTIISGCEIVNSKKIAAQCEGICPVFTIDKSVGVSMYLMNKECAAISSFTTSMSSEMNVSIPGETEDSDFKEMPIPEQFVHRIADGAVTSEVSELYK